MSTPEKSYGWGLIGPGRFARMFSDELRTVSRARLAAVASRDYQRACEFRDDYQFDTAYGTYDELLADPAVDIVYIVVPHAFHAVVAEQALRAKKAVFCEKPLTPSAAASRKLIELAREQNTFLMEGLKTGFLPAVQQARTWIQEGRIGNPRILKADFCFRGSADPSDRLLNPDLAGGAILDVGIYPLSLAMLLLGPIEEVKATGVLAPTGVEESASISTRHKNGSVAALTCSINASHSLDAIVLGETGKIQLPHSHRATEVTLHPDEEGCQPETFSAPDETRVVAEINAAMAALDDGAIECPGHTHADSLALAKAMDEALLQIKGHTF